MHTWTTVSLTVSVFVVFVNSAALAVEDPAGELPAAQTVTYWLREAPEDPNSAVVFGVTLKLQAQASAGSAIGWGVSAIEFYEVDAGVASLAWVDDAPAVGTEDGRWWVTHADPEAPELAEFVMPPPLSGTGTAENPNGDDLDYWLEGSEGNQPLIPSYTVMAFLSYQLSTPPTSPPIRSGEDEPVEAGEGYNPPV